MCKDMKKIPNSPPNRLPNSPHPLKKVKKSGKSLRVNRSTSQRVWGLAGVGSAWVCHGSAWVCYGSVMGLSWVREAEHLFNPLNPINT